MPRTSKTWLFLALAVLAVAPAVDRAQATPAPPAPPAQHTVNLNWAASKSRIMGYNVYRATKSGGPYEKVTLVPVAAPHYADASVKAGNTYFYVVSCVGADKKEGPKSSEIRATVPAP
jgi:fibronectin type 3 domain-containing protein